MMFQAFMLLITVAFSSAAQLLWKARALVHAGDEKATSQGYVFSMITDPWVWGAISCTGLGMISWMLALRRMDIGLAFPVIALVYLIVPVTAHFVFGEGLPPLRIAGILLILVGVAMSTVVTA